MNPNDKSARVPEARRVPRPAQGWTQLHSWVFLVIVAIGLAMIVTENRYHYLNPLGLGKAYRIDKLFGGIQEFHPLEGWVTAQLSTGSSPKAVAQAPPPAVTSRAVPNMPGAGSTEVSPSQATGTQPPTVSAQIPKEPQCTMEDMQGKQSPAPAAMDKPVMEEKPPSGESRPQMTREERLKAFKELYPDYGEEEFKLADEDLYPDWKKRVSPDGTWSDFLGVYKQFIQWWVDKGSPPEPGFKLWQDFWASRGQQR